MRRLDVKAARFGLSWLERRRADVLSVRYTWSLGLRGLGGTEHFDGQPDSSFHASLLDTPQAREDLLEPGRHRGRPPGR